MGRIGVQSLGCDGEGCEVIILPDPFVYRKSVTSVEAGMRMTAELDVGWVYMNGLDLCPDCQKPTVAV